MHTSTKKRLQRALHVIDELCRVDRLVDKDLLVPPKGVYGPAHCNVRSIWANVSCGLRCL
jgi:hypothetical protein